MRIANFKKPNIGEATPVGKWLFSLEILACPPHQYGIFRPYIHVVAIKIIDPGEESYMIGGREMKKKGFWKVFAAPFHIRFEFEWYNKVTKQ